MIKKVATKLLRTKKSLFALFTIASYLFASFFLPAYTYAIDALNKHAIIYDTVFYDPCADPRDEQTQAGANNVYQVGDSITHAMEDEDDGIVSRFEAENWNADTNGVNSSALFNPPGHADSPRDGFAALNTDRDKVADADAIVVEFGTNTTENSTQQYKNKIGEYVDAIRAINPDIKIYWVDIFSTGTEQAHAQTYSERNRAIYDQSEAKGFSVINAYQELTGDGDPFNINLSDQGHLVDTIHLTNDANSQLMDFIVEKVKAGGGGNGAVSAEQLTSLPLRDKLAQLLMPRTDNEADFNTATAAKVGGVLVGRHSVQSLSSKVKEYQRSAETPLLASTDGEGGDISVDGVENPPKAYELGQQQPEEITTTIEAYGNDLANFGINMDLAPVADIVDAARVDDTNAVIGRRSLGSEKQQVIDSAKAFAAGLRNAGVLPTFKHFPGHGKATTAPGGSTLANSHTQDAYVKNINQIRDADMSIFADLAQDTPAAIMMGHLIINGFDGTTPASISHKVVTDELRDRIGFDGVVITDDLAGMAPIYNRMALPEAAFQSIRAGNDIALWGANPSGASAVSQLPAVLDRLEQAVNNGALTEDRINESLTRIALAKSFATQTEAAAENNSPCSPCGVSGNGTLPDSVPEPFNGIFTRAAEKHNVEPALVAGIFHYGEHGGANGAGWPDAAGPWASSPVGASGPFQFMPATWESYKDDGNGDGVFDIQNLEDSAFGAAKYLGANGGTVGAPLGDPHGGAQAASISNAIWHYNHADWYVDNVLQGYYLYGGQAGADNPPVPVPTAPAGGASDAPSAPTGSATGCAGATGQFQWPTDPLGVLLACWGDQRGSHLHSGIDIPVPVGSKVLAADGGTVEVAGVAGGYGNVIVINHNNGYWTLYGHNDSLMKEVGNTVAKGDQIAVSGNTGNSQGPHLHFNIQKIAGVQGDASGTVNPLTNGLAIPEGVDNQAHCENFPDGGRDTGFRS